MNLLDLQLRLRQLNAIKFPSDEEIEEKEQILENIAILRNQTRKPKEIENKLVNVVMEQKSKREHSVVGKAMIKGFKAVVEHFKEKPVTLEELQALKLKAIKERYKADIAKSKKVQRDSKGDMFGSSQTKRKSSGRSSLGGDSMDDISKILRGTVKGSNNLRLFSNHSSKDIRKYLR